MSESPLAPHAASPAELKARQEATLTGEPFVVLRDGEGKQILVSLGGRERITIGRRAESDISVTWDGRISRLHAELERVGGDWVVLDDGLSTNGTWLNDRRLTGRARLRHGDLVRVGSTMLAFCSPADGVTGTAIGYDPQFTLGVSPAQRRVLVALCRSVLEGDQLAVPPTNAQLAEQLFLSIDAVKTHMRALFEAFRLEDVPRGQKRSMLIQRAVGAGVVTRKDVQPEA